MRLKPGRPDIGAYADRFDLPAAAPTDLGIRFLGVATLIVDDGASTLVTDGFFSRPGLTAVALGRIAPDESRIDACLERVGLHSADAVLPVHSHYDHALDSAVVAGRLRAPLVGGSSTAQVGRGGGLAEDRIVLVTPGAAMVFGAYEVTFTESRHCPPDRYPGEITTPVAPPARTKAYRCGEAWSILIRHRSGQSVLVQGSAGFVPGALDGKHADVVYLGVGQLGVQPDAYIEQYWREVVETVSARRVVLIHWDDFFRPLDRPLRALPYAGDDLDHTLRVLSPLADRAGVGLSFPTVWRREDPWHATDR